MENKPKNFYITTTLPYINAPLHMGHALEFIRADAVARYNKLRGYDVYFNTGTDEHGIKIFNKAKDEGLDPQTFVNNNFSIFKEQIKIFGLTDDIHFIRTTDEKHIKMVQDFWRKIQNNDYIYKKNYEAKYCVGCESEKTDSELVNGECPLHPGKKLEIINEENYFFKYSAFTDRLLNFYKKNPNFIVPDFRFNELRKFVEKGLQDFSISRLKEKMPWGIEVPGDSQHVIYVWFDALINYISTLAGDNDSTVEELVLSDNFKKYWIYGTPTQYCGKDNIRFQGAMWQALLMAAFDSDQYCSHQIIVNGFITGEGGIRMSKTLGNVIDPRDVVNEYSTEALRYFLLREIGSFEDSPFTMERFKESYNSGLANGLGNLTSRILTMSSKYLDEKITGQILDDEKHKGLNLFITDGMDSFDINSVCRTIWIEISKLDKKISEEEVFKIIKNDLDGGKKKLIDYISKLSNIAIELEFIIPETSSKIQELIRQNKKPEIPLFLRKA